MCDGAKSAVLRTEGELLQLIDQLEVEGREEGERERGKGFDFSSVGFGERERERESAKEQMNL